ncbi:hypothetical protein [Jiangella mangrovi]|uniref:Uncharacterized protein n=1 Tax=Jiangella mangrovi TaxID=1524084 RepID=A0A7W9GLA9_9ACTN|nr:hypothetical protein [Jiangella mangrovi]MBB5785990.1 hypothetical protein [Jiangella mangrovi]
MFDQPYDVDLDDPLTRGRMRHAAKHGDQRARATLRKWRGDGGQETEQTPRESNGGLERGRAAFEAKQARKKDPLIDLRSDGPDAA